MKDTLRPGLTSEFKFRVPENKTVPYLYPEAPEFQLMPKVLATGYMVGLLEWACLLVINPHLDWPNEQSVGTLVNFTHSAATPADFTVTVHVKLEKVEGRKLTLSVVADDGIDEISRGTHERFVIDAAKFNSKLAEKIARTASA